MWIIYKDFNFSGMEIVTHVYERPETQSGKQLCLMRLLRPDTTRLSFKPKALDKSTA